MAPSGPLAAEAPIAATRQHQEGRGLLRARCGFELVSAAIPARFSRRSHDPHWHFLGEAELAADLQLAMRQFVAELPVDAALFAEHRFTSVGDGGIRIRTRLFVETPSMPAAVATDLAVQLREEMSVCLRVLAEWYTFEPTVASRRDDRFWSRPTARIFAQRRLFACETTRPIGFGGSRGPRHPTQIFLPTRAHALGDSSPPRRDDASLLLEPSRFSSLSASIRAAAGLSNALTVRIVLRRRNVLPDELEVLQAAAPSISASLEGENVGDVAASIPAVTGVGSVRARSTIDLLLAEPECVEMQIEADAADPQAKAWLRILAEELFPGFSTDVVEAGSASRRSKARHQLDLSQLLTPGSPLPPLLPSPMALEALGFPRHFANPTVSFPSEGLLLGRAQVGGTVLDVRMPHADRSLHTYVLGATGTGKSTLLLNMMRQDLAAGHGLALLDPHGDLYEELQACAQATRRADLVLFDPHDPASSLSLNPLDFAGRPTVEGVSKVANDMLAIFDKLYDMRQAGGPIFEDYFRHAMLLAAAAPAGSPLDSPGSTIPTLATVGDVLRNKSFRQACTARVDQVYGPRPGAEIRQFVELAHATRGDAAFENTAVYVVSKLSRFVTNATMRRLFCAGPRTLDCRQIMDEGKVLLVNLSKGDLGGPDARMVGMMLTRYLFDAALSRADQPRHARRGFYLYLDEFQNFVAADVGDMLAEARKFGLFLVLANQTLAQLIDRGDRQLADAVLGNIATRLFFRIGQNEAAAVEAGFTPHFDDHDLANLPDRHVMCRLQMEGKPTLPFVFKTQTSQSDGMTQNTRLPRP